MDRQRWAVAALAVAAAVAGQAAGQIAPPKQPNPANPPSPPNAKPGQPAPPPGQPGAKAEEKKKPAPRTFKNRLRVRVVTKTGGANKFANTSTGRIYLLLNGDPEHKARLAAKGKKPFERGATDQFDLLFDLPAGEVKSVRLLSETADMWKCESFSVQFFQAGKQSAPYRFKPEQYFSASTERKLFHAVPFRDFPVKPALDEDAADGK